MIAIFHIVRIITHQITSQWGLHAQWSMKVARQKRSEICAVRVAKSKKNDLFWEHFFLIRRPRNTERVVIFFSMLMRLHARFRTRRDVFVCVCIQRICINTSKYDNLIYTHIYYSLAVSRYFFCTIYVHPTTMTLHVHFYVYTYYLYLFIHIIYIYNQIYIYNVRINTANAWAFPGTATTTGKASSLSSSSSNPYWRSSMNVEV